MQNGFLPILCSLVGRILEYHLVHTRIIRTSKLFCYVTCMYVDIPGSLVSTQSLLQNLTPYSIDYQFLHREEQGLVLLWSLRVNQVGQVGQALNYLRLVASFSARRPGEFSKTLSTFAIVHRPSYPVWECPLPSYRKADIGVSLEGPHGLSGKGIVNSSGKTIA